MTEENEFKKRMRLYFELLRADATVSLPKYEAIYNQILNDLKQKYPDDFASVSLELDVKPLDRILEKVETLYRWDITRLPDLVRARIVVETSDQIGRFIEYMKKSPPANMITVKNHFAVPTNTGYRNVWMMLETETFPQIEFKLEHQSMLKAQTISREIEKKQEDLEADIATKRTYWISEPPESEGSYQYFIFGGYIPIRGIISQKNIILTEAPSLKEDNKLELAMEYMRAIRSDEDIMRVDRDKFALYCKQYRAKRIKNLNALFKKFEQFAGKENTDGMKAAIEKSNTYGAIRGLIIGAETFEDNLHKDQSLLHYEIAEDGTLIFLFDSTKIPFEGGKKGFAHPIKAHKKTIIWKALLPKENIPSIWDKNADFMLMKTVRQYFQPKKGFDGANHGVVFAMYDHLLGFIKKLELLPSAAEQKVSST